MAIRSLVSALAASASAFALVTSSLTANAQQLNPPSQFTPASFTNYLNTLSWEDGKRRKFSNLNGCEKVSAYYYGCKYGYVRITDPMGSRFCEIDKDSSHSFDNIYDFAVVINGDRVGHGSTYAWNCR